MEINEELIKKIATVARLNLSEEEIKEFVPQLKEVLDSFNEINNIDTTGIEPSYQPVKIKNSLREDEIKPSLSVKDALKNSKHKKEDYFMGPRSI